MGNPPYDGWFAPEASTVITSAPPELTVEWCGRTYPAAPVASGAAFEIFTDSAEPGFLPNPSTAATHPYRRFVHASQVLGEAAAVLSAPDPAITAPLAHGIDPAMIQKLSQSPYGGRAEHALLSKVRASAAITFGTRMVKPLSPHQAARQLRSTPVVWGMCFREHDIAALRTPTDRRVLAGDPHPGEDVTFALRWRAGSPADYVIPSIEEYSGLVGMSGSKSKGGLVLGTGFTPSSDQLVPEFLTAGLADLPLPDRSELLAYTEDGSEIVAFQYLSERNAWTRMAGPQWRHMLATLPGVPAGQEWFPATDAPHVGLYGNYRGQTYPAVADPPHEFRIRAKTAAARFVVTDVTRSSLTTRWRDVNCAVVGSDEKWLRLRLCQPTEASVGDTGAECAERGVYECWAPSREVGEIQQNEARY